MQRSVGTIAKVGFVVGCGSSGVDRTALLGRTMMRVSKDAVGTAFSSTSSTLCPHRRGVGGWREDGEAPRYYGSSPDDA